MELKKLKPHFYGPYRIKQRIREVAYELNLPEKSKIHNVFHVSCIKKALGQNIVPSIELPPLDDEGKLVSVPEVILGFMENILKNKVITEYGIRWKDLSAEDAIWEGSKILKHPSLQLLEGKQFREAWTVMSPFQN